MKNRHAAVLVTSLSLVAITAAVAQGPGFRGGRGPDETFVADRDDFHFLLRRHDKIRRTTKELPDGIESITQSDDQEIVAHIQKHVAAMYVRVEKKRPIRMRDPLFAEIFRHAGEIEMQLENLPNGIRVVETSDDPYVARLIKAHAKVVSGFAERGFDEAHRMHAVPDGTSEGEDVAQSKEDLQTRLFIEFDRIYIPALALTNRQKQVPARKAMERLSNAWDTELVAKFHRTFDDDQWPLDVSQIAQALALATAQLDSGKPQKAHETLEPVRDLLMHARRRNEIAYPLDSISRFHATMEAIVKPAQQMTADSLTDAQLARFAELAEQAAGEWRLVEAAEFNLDFYGKTEPQQRQLPALLEGVRLTITKLLESLEQGDKAAILQSARALKPPFAKTYMFFGDFPRD